MFEMYLVNIMLVYQPQITFLKASSEDYQEQR